MAEWWRAGGFPLGRLTPYSAGGRREEFAKHGRRRVYRPGELIYPQTGVYHDRDDIVLMQRGQAKETRTNSAGRRFLVSIYQPGDLVGILEYLCLRKACKVTALTEVHALTLSSQQFKAFLERNPDLWEELTRSLAEEVNRSQDRLAEMAFDKAEVRLARILMELRDTAEPPLTQSELADLLGVRRETVEKTLSGWRSENIVSTDPRKVRVVRPDRLAEIAGTSLATLEANREFDSGGGCSHPSHHRSRLRDSASRMPSPADGPNGLSASN
ncbi:Crp/Fnr family transcriptional regulator [Polymorphospora sp. NPDC050346]|uniref:Crp/Fnr family transcriptional regulator n=1 Tax=Polymorphospora sp. NPDC050346 TaxID=3155780 RepID=UPI0033EBD375